MTGRRVTRFPVFQWREVLDPLLTHLPFFNRMKCSHRVFFGIFLFLLISLFADVLLSGGGKVLSGIKSDLTQQYLPQRAFAFSQMRQGHLVQWDPFHYSGRPFLGDVETAMFYPLNGLYLFLSPGLAVNVDILLHLMIGGAFMFAWMAFRGLSPLSCLLVACVYTFGGAHVAHIVSGHMEILEALAWVPAIFWAADHWAREGFGKWVWIGMGAVGLQLLTGQIQYFFYTFLGVGLYVLFQGFGKPRWVQGLACTAVAYGGGVTLSAIQLLPGLEAALKTIRGRGLDWESARIFSFPPENLLTLVMPYIFGSPHAFPYWGKWFYSEMTLYIGVGSLVLVGFGILRGGKERSGLLAGLALFFLFLALGDSTPFYHWFYRFLPGLSFFRGPGKFTFLVTLFLAVLAGMGFERLERRKLSPALPWILLSVGISACLAGGLLSRPDFFLGGRTWDKFVSAAAGWELLEKVRVEKRTDFIRIASGRIGFDFLRFAGTCLAVSLWAWGFRKRRCGTWPLALLVVMDLAFFASSNRPAFPYSDYEMKRNTIRYFLSREPGAFRCFNVTPTDAMPFEFDIWGHDDKVSTRYSEFITASKGLTQIQETLLKGAIPPCFKLLGLRYLLAEEGNGLKMIPTHFPEIPRVFLADRWKQVNDESSLLAWVTRPDFDPLRLVLLEQNPGIESGSPGARTSLKWAETDTETVRIDAVTNGPRLLIFAENASQGWKVMPLPGDQQGRYDLLSADFIYQAIPLNKGIHHFKIHYETPGFSEGWNLFFCPGPLFMLGRFPFYEKRKKARLNFTRQALSLFGP